MSKMLLPIYIIPEGGNLDTSNISQKELNVWLMLNKKFWGELPTSLWNNPDRIENEKIMGDIQDRQTAITLKLYAWDVNSRSVKM
jgi:hypothetical protein